MFLQHLKKGNDNRVLVQTFLSSSHMQINLNLLNIN
jgi:hypothetical protein